MRYKTMLDFGGVGVVPVLSAIVDTIPMFFPIILFVIWVFGSASSYFVILKLTGRKRFFNALTSFSFITFLLSLIIAAMNNTTTTFLSGYWVGFYIVMTIISYTLLDRYK